MVFLYDNMTATVIGMSIVLILATIQLRTVERGIAETSRHIVKKQAQRLASWMEDDLEQLGQNMSPGGIAFENPQKETYDRAPGDVITRQFTFYRDSSGVQLETRYEIDPAGTQMVDGDSTTVYRLTRFHEGTEDGRSTPMLGYFDVDMLDRNANLVSNPKSNRDKVQSVRVQFSVVAPFQNRETILSVVHHGSIIVRHPLADS